MWLAITLKARGPSKLEFLRNLWLLAMFALLRSVANWIEMFLLFQKQVAPTSDYTALEIMKVLLLPLSTVFLLQFATRSIIAARQRHFWLRWVPVVLTLLWLLVLIYTIGFTSMAKVEWLLAADVWASYFLCLPACALAGLAVFLCFGACREMGLPHVARDCIGAMAGFGLKAVVAGLIVAPTPYFPASFLNESSFLAVTGVPVQVFRAITTVAVAYFVVRCLEVFEAEQRQQVEAAIQSRLEAQQDALEAQRRACEELEQWSQQLEDVVNTIAMAINQPFELKSISSIT
jgi:hypothetical protein